MKVHPILIKKQNFKYLISTVSILSIIPIPLSSRAKIGIGSLLKYKYFLSNIYISIITDSYISYAHRLFKNIANKVIFYQFFLLTFKFNLII